jgi:two-component system chemotaxis response regulator CheB
MVARPWLVVVAASAGGLQAVRTVLAALPDDFPGTVVIVQHRSATKESILENLLAKSARMPVKPALPGEPITPGTVFVARPDRHLMIDQDRCFAYRDGTRIRGVLSSAVPLLDSAADVFADRLIAVVLTGSGTDATDGVQRVKHLGGIVIAQDPATAAFDGMPLSAIRSGAVDRVLPLEDIAPALIEITRTHPVET